MADILHKTKGIVLKTVKYGETSLIVTVYTELFGMQSYLVNGVRTPSKQGAAKANFFQPAALLDLVVYYNEFRQLHRIKEYKWIRVNAHLFTDVLKNGVALFMIELFTRCLKEPEANPDLFGFVEDCLNSLNDCSDKVMANFPLFFGIHLAHFFGFAPQHRNTTSDRNPSVHGVLDLDEGVFTDSMPNHGHYLENPYAQMVAEVQRVQQPSELADLVTNAASRSKILEALVLYYSLHIQDFGKLKTLPVLQEILR